MEPLNFALLATLGVQAFVAIGLPVLGIYLLVQLSHRYNRSHPTPGLRQDKEPPQD